MFIQTGRYWVYAKYNMYIIPINTLYTTSTVYTARPVRYTFTVKFG